MVSSTQLICDSCGKEFSRPSKLEAHKRAHLGQRIFACDYEGCEKAYFRFQHLKRHVERIHEHPEKEFKCTEGGCLASFDSDFALLQHSNRSHSKAKSNFRTHHQATQEIHSENRKEFKCNFENCTRIYRYKKNLTSHIRRAHEGCLYACPKCDRKLSTNQKLKYHVAQHDAPVKKRVPKRNIDKFARLFAGPCTNILELPIKNTKRRTKHISHILAAKQLTSLPMTIIESQSQGAKSSSCEFFEQEIPQNEY